MQKIGIMGTHGTGKTTLAFELALKYKKENPELNVNILPEVARSCPFLINESTKIESQLWIYHQQMVVELEQSMHSDVLICDRTILDNLAYTRNASITRDIDFEIIIENNLKQAIEWLKTYNIIYWLRPVYKLISDGTRSDNLKFQKEIDKILSGWIKKYEINVMDMDMQKIPVDQELVKKLVASGMKPYTIEKQKGIPRSVVEDIISGKDRPFWMKKPTRNRKDKDMCECCGYRKKDLTKLCLVCFHGNSGCVGDD